MSPVWGTTFHSGSLSSFMEAGYPISLFCQLREYSEIGFPNRVKRFSGQAWLIVAEPPMTPSLCVLRDSKNL
jgi:hypothetical protein